MAIGAGKGAQGGKVARPHSTHGASWQRPVIANHTEENTLRVVPWVLGTDYAHSLILASS